MGNIYRFMFFFFFALALNISPALAMKNPGDDNNPGKKIITSSLIAMLVNKLSFILPGKLTNTVTSSNDNKKRKRDNPNNINSGNNSNDPSRSDYEGGSQQNQRLRIETNSNNDHQSNSPSFLQNMQGHFFSITSSISSGISSLFYSSNSNSDNLITIIPFGIQPPERFSRLWWEFTTSTDRLSSLFPNFGNVGSLVANMNGAMTNDLPSVQLANFDLSYTELEELIDQHMAQAEQLMDLMWEHLDDVIEYLKNNPEQAQEWRLDPNNIAGLLESQQRTKKEPTVKVTALLHLLVRVPLAYRMVYNLEEGGMDRMCSYAFGSQVAESQYEALLKERLNPINEYRRTLNLKPLTSIRSLFMYKEMLKKNGWKQKFFQEGTKPARWRKLYNDFRMKIIEKIGGDLELFEDKRLINWIKDAHESLEQEFHKRPDSLPT